MKKISKILSLVLAACMIFGMLPALSAGAADAEAGNFMEITSGNYLPTAICIFCRRRSSGTPRRPPAEAPSPATETPTRSRSP